jgi:recombination protein RecA
VKVKTPSKPTQAKVRSSNKKVAEVQAVVADTLLQGKVVDKQKLAQIKSLAEKLNTNLKGEGRIYTGNDHPKTVRLPSGVLAFDIVCGGGLPGGHLVEVFGPASTGKTTLSIKALREVQARGEVAAVLAGEGCDVDYMASHGIDVDNLFIVDGAVGDTMLETALTLLESGVLGGMLFDSFQSLGTTRESENGIETEAYGNAGAPQMWGRIMRRCYRLQSLGKINSTVLLGISQARAKIGGMQKGYAADDGQPTQIRAIQHWKSVSVRCIKGDALFTGPNRTGRIYSREFKLRCEKNKTAGTDGFSAQYEFRTRDHEGIPYGIDNVGTAFVHAVAYGLIERSGTRYQVGDEKVNGQDAALAALRGKPDLIDSLSERIRVMAGEGT